MKSAAVRKPRASTVVSRAASRTTKNSRSPQPARGRAATVVRKKVTPPSPAAKTRAVKPSKATATKTATKSRRAAAVQPVKVSAPPTPRQTVAKNKPQKSPAVFATAPDAVVINARRRQIDPTTCERDYSNAEVEFMNALDDYKRQSGRLFPTCSEILEVIRKLGYTKPNENASIA